jgi:hypothetical protein
MHYTGSGLALLHFTFTGNSITQFEDGIFVTEQREMSFGTPEPGSLFLVGSVLLGFGLRRKLAA